VSRFNVSPEKEAALAEQMARLGIREEDLAERFVRSSGPGGQNVNKVSTCVWLKHRPTGIEVKVQRERSQVLNRFLARRWLARRVEERLLGRASAERQRVEKIRRQKRRRSRRSREKMLRDKRLQSLKKTLRVAPPSEVEE
jgi:protein subunit release factor B